MQPVNCGVVVVGQSFAHCCVAQQLFISAHMARYDGFGVPILEYRSEPLVAGKEVRGLIDRFVGGRHASRSTIEGSVKLCV